MIKEISGFYSKMFQNIYNFIYNYFKSFLNLAKEMISHASNAMQKR